MPIDAVDHGLRLLALIPEAYGGFGGIAVYNVDLFNALCALPQVASATVIPRLIRDMPDRIPDKIDWRDHGASGIAAYSCEVVRAASQRLDLIICTHLNLLPYARLASLATGAPIVCVLYGTEAWKPTRRFLVDRLVQHCSKFLSISDVSSRRFQSWSGIPDDRIAPLPNAVHVEKFGVGEWPAYLAQRYGTTGCRVIMTLGRLDTRQRQKGFDEMIALMPRLLAADPDLRYLIAGGGDDRPRLEALVGTLKLNGKVIFCGLVTDEEKADHYRLADVFSMVGRQEGFGFVFLEALACGTPVIASSLDGSRDAILGGELGELADPDEPDTVVEALARALAKPRGIPERLAYYSVENFKRRLEQAIAPYAEAKIRKVAA